MSLYITDKDDPKPQIGCTLHIRLRGLKDGDGKPYDLSGASKIYATIKDSLSDPDVDADAQIDTVSNTGQFILTYASSGSIDVIFSPSDTVALAAGVLYYVDVKAIWASGQIISLCRDAVIFDSPVTLSQS